MNINISVFLNYMTSDKLTKASTILLQQLLALQLNKLASVEQDGLICPPLFSLTKVSKTLEIKFTYSASVCYERQQTALPLHFHHIGMYM